MPSDDDVALRTLASTRKILGLGRTRVYQMCKTGELELVEIGRRGKRVTQASIDQYVKNAKRVQPRHPKDK